MDGSRTSKNGNGVGGSGGKKGKRKVELKDPEADDLVRALLPPFASSCTPAGLWYRRVVGCWACSGSFGGGRSFDGRRCSKGALCSTPRLGATNLLPLLASLLCCSLLVLFPSADY